MWCVHSAVCILRCNLCTKHIPSAPFCCRCWYAHCKCTEPKPMCAQLHVFVPIRCTTIRCIAIASYVYLRFYFSISSLSDLMLKILVTTFILSKLKTTIVCVHSNFVLLLFHANAYNSISWCVWECECSLDSIIKPVFDSFPRKPSHYYERISVIRDNTELMGFIGRV